MKLTLTGSHLKIIKNEPYNVEIEIDGITDTDLLEELNYCETCKKISEYQKILDKLQTATDALHETLTIHMEEIDDIYYEGDF
jgi:hypothetical protein